MLNSPLCDLVSPKGWDISSMNIADAMQRARVLDYSLQQQLRPLMAGMKPRPSIYFPDFIAANQEKRADNVLKGTKQELLEKIREDIRDFQQTSGVDKVSGVLLFLGERRRGRSLFKEAGILTVEQQMCYQHLQYCNEEYNKIKEETNCPPTPTPTPTNRKLFTLAESSPTELVVSKNLAQWHFHLNVFIFTGDCSVDCKY